MPSLPRILFVAVAVVGGMQSIGLRRVAAAFAPRSTTLWRTQPVISSVARWMSNPDDSSSSSTVAQPEERSEEEKARIKAEREARK